MARGSYDPRLAWLRAAVYFAACLAIAWAVGPLAELAQAPAVAAQQADAAFWALTGLAFGVILIGYGVIWPRGTFTDGRAAHPFLAPLFGAVWGACQGLLFLSFWSLIERTGIGTGWTAAASYVAIGAYNGSWHRFVWDIYVSPPHNYTAWNGRKVLWCHTPNLLVSLLHYALYGNAAIFVALQTLALALSAWAMRFPAPWDRYTAPAGSER